MSAFSHLSEAWNSSESTSRNTTSRIPDGDHVAVIKDMVVVTNDKGPSLQTTLYFPGFNREENCWNPLTANALRFVKQTLKAAHLDGYGADEVENHLGEAKMRKVNVTIKTSGKYRNYYLGATGDAPEEEVPFD